MVESQPTRDIGHVFVGRQREMAELRSALDDALSGHGRMVMLVGEPGIGKTRTAQELASYAEQQRALVLWGRCNEDEGPPPYWPWVQAMRSYVEQASVEQLIVEMGPGAADIAEIVPEIRGKLNDLGIPPTLEPGQARFRLFDSITIFLKNAALRQPLMLVLDDLHWADRSSLLLLEFLAREIGTSCLLLIGAYRDIEDSRRHALSQSLGALVREQLFHRVQLDGLTEQEVGELVEGSAGITLPAEAAQVIHKRTDGNPFFVGEVTRQGTLDDITANQGWASTIPEGVRDAIGRRLNRLSDQCNQMLTTSSIIGQEFEFRLLHSLLAETTEDHLLAAMDEAVGAHLIEELPKSVGLYQFTHALIRETLSVDLSTTRRARLHARIAESMERLYGDDVDAHAAQLAYHFAEAQTSTGPEKFVHYSLLAGDQAMATYAHEEALGHFERGLVARQVDLSGTVPGTDGEIAALLFGFGCAQAATLERQHRQEAITSLRRAFEYYVEAGDIERAVAVVERPGRILVGDEAGPAELLSRALALVPPGSHESARLLPAYGMILYAGTGDYEGAQDSFDRALGIARREGDAPLEMRILANAAFVHYFHLHPQRAVDSARLAIVIGQRVDDPQAEAMAHYSAVNGLHPLGSLDGAQHHAYALLTVAERLRDRSWLASALSRNEIVSRLKGDWRAARDFSDRGLAGSPRDPRILAFRVLLDYHTGDFSATEIYLERLLEVMNARAPGPNAEYAYPAIVLQLTAKMSGNTDRLAVGEAAAVTVLSSPSASPLFVRRAHAALALTAVLRDDPIAAADQYAALASAQATMLDGGFASADRILALLSATMGNQGQATIHFEDALAFCRKAGYRPELAWACHDYAESLLERNGAGDGQRASSLLDEALSVATELGMRPLMERVEARLAGLESRAPRTPEYPSGLSQREVEVLRLIATGKTDREIAEELFISFRTVGNHVRNILNKTNTTNRTEAATYANQHGLIHSS